MPNETAPAHRHTAFAMRFIIEGHGGFTAVQGERIKMERGDFILTPVWTWHDHGNDASGPMIWLDGLDLPQFQHFPVHFAEHYSEPRYPAKNIDTSASPIVWKWNQTYAELSKQPGDFAVYRYLSKADGKSEVSKRLGAQVERISKGAQSPMRRETASSVYHVIMGKGYSMIGDKRFDWTESDSMSIPAWTPFQHFADSGADAYLYRFDDKPMLKNLGFYREEGKPIDYN